MKIEHVENINATVTSVWELTLDVAALPSLTPTMTSVEPLDDRPLQVGSQVRIRQPGQRPRIWTVSELVPERRFAWSTRAMGMTMVGSHELTENPGGTSNALSIELDGFLAPILGPLLKRPIHKALATENAGFKARAESLQGESR